MQASSLTEHSTPRPSVTGHGRQKSLSAGDTETLFKPARRPTGHPVIRESGSDEEDEAYIPIVLCGAYEDRLCIEMLILFKELLPTHESYQRRLSLVGKIKRLVNREWRHRDINVHLFGSSVNDLGSHQSDVDLCITTPWAGLRNVRVLAKMFRKCGMQQVVCVPHAKVPIVRLFDPEFQLACDINVNNTLALQNTEMVRKYVAIDPRVRPLIMIIKHWAKQRILNDAANGGTLSTYTWTCMVINFLQMRQPPILPVLHSFQYDDQELDSQELCNKAEETQGFGLTNRESLGGLLFAFFRRFAIEFDYDEQVVSVRHGRYLSKHQKGWDTGRNRFCLCVEEPFNVTRNLGNSADMASVRGLQMELFRALDMLISNESLSKLCLAYSYTSTPPPLTKETSLTPTHVLLHTLPIPLHSSASSHNQQYSSLNPCPKSIKDSSAFTPIEPSKLRHPRSHPLQLPESRPTNPISPRFLDGSAHNSWHKENPLPVFPSAMINTRNPPENERTVDGIFARYKRNSFHEGQKSIRGRRKSDEYVSHVQQDSGQNEYIGQRRRLSLCQESFRSLESIVPCGWPSGASHPASPTTGWSQKNSQGTRYRRRRWSTNKNIGSDG